MVCEIGMSAGATVCLGGKHMTFFVMIPLRYDITNFTVFCWNTDVTFDFLLEKEYTLVQLR